MRTKYPNVFVNPTIEEMGPETYRFAWDMDSVLNDMGEDGMAAWISKHFGIGDARGFDETGVQRFNFAVPGVRPKDIFMAVNKFILEESPSLLPSPFMFEVMKYVTVCTRKPILVVTARSENTVDVTFNWLNENLGEVPFRCYMIHSKPKTEFLTHHNVTYFVDDRYKTIMNLYYNIPAPVMFNRPWNQGRLFYDWIRINDLRDMIPLINMETGRTPMDWPHWVPFPKPRGERITKKYATIS